MVVDYVVDHLQQPRLSLPLVHQVHELEDPKELYESKQPHKAQQAGKAAKALGRTPKPVWPQIHKIGAPRLLDSITPPPSRRKQIQLSTTFRAHFFYKNPLLIGAGALTFPGEIVCFQLCCTILERDSFGALGRVEQ